MTVRVVCRRQSLSAHGLIPSSISARTLALILTVPDKALSGKSLATTDYYVYDRICRTPVVIAPGEGYKLNSVVRCVAGDMVSGGSVLIWQGFEV